MEFLGKLGNSNVFSARKQVISKKKKKKKKKRSWPKLRLIFRPKSKIQTFFPPKNKWSPKKKIKKKKVFTEFETDFSTKIGNRTFFPPKIRWSPKKKKKKEKRSSPKLRLIFRPKSEIQTFEGGLFSYGGLFSIFHKKSASRAPNTCGFAYFTSQWGGTSPPRPPLATLLVASLRPKVWFGNDLN